MVQRTQVWFDHERVPIDYGAKVIRDFINVGHVAFGSKYSSPSEVTPSALISQDHLDLIDQLASFGREQNNASQLELHGSPFDIKRIQQFRLWDKHVRSPLRQPKLPNPRSDSPEREV